MVHNREHCRRYAANVAGMSRPTAYAVFVGVNLPRALNSPEFPQKMMVVAHVVRTSVEKAIGLLLTDSHLSSKICHLFPGR